MLKEMKNRFLDRNYKRVDKINLGLSMKDKIMFLLPGFQMYIAGKIIERMENIIKTHTKEAHVYINLWNNDAILGENLKFEGYIIGGSLPLFSILGLTISYIFKSWGMESIDFFLLMGLLSIFFMIGLDCFALTFLFTQKRVEENLKNYINDKIKENVLNTVLEIEDFETLKENIDHQVLSDFMLKNNFKIKYCDLSTLDFESEKKKKYTIQKGKAMEILSAKSNIREKVEM